MRNGKDADGNFVVSKDEKIDKKDKKEQEKEIKKGISFLDLDSVVYYQNMLKE